MSDLPEMNFKGKDDEEKKKGFLPWLRSRLGFGGRGATGGAGGALPGAANVGRAAFGASSGMGGIGGLLAGKFGLIATVAVIGTAIGTSMYLKDSGPMANTSAFNSNRTQDNYVPAIMRQKQNQGSSLDMLRDTNKGEVSMEAYDADGYDKNGYNADGYDRDGYDKDGYNKDGYDKDGYNKDGYDKDGYGRDGYNKDGYDRNGLDRNGAQSPVQGAMAQEMMGKLAKGNGAGGLSGGMGGGSQFGGAGGSINKFNPGSTGGKSGFGNLGATPKLGQMKNFLAQRPRPTFSSSKGKRPQGSSGLYAQAKGIRDMQRTGIGADTIDQKRGIGNEVWDGTTPKGTMNSGTGNSNGSPGRTGNGADSKIANSERSVVKQPESLKDSPCGEGYVIGADGKCGKDDGKEDGKDDKTPSAPDQPTESSPWMGLPEQALALIGISLALAIAGAWLIKMALIPGLQWLYFVGAALIAVAILCAAAAAAIGVILATTYNQPVLGGLYVAGGVLAGTAAGLCLMGNDSAAWAVKGLWLSGASAVLLMISTMAARQVGLPETIKPISLDVPDPLDVLGHAVVTGEPDTKSGTPTSETTSKTGDKDTPAPAASYTPVEKQTMALAENYEKLDAVQGKIDKVQTEINGVQTKITALETKLEGVNSGVKANLDSAEMKNAANKDRWELKDLREKKEALLEDKNKLLKEKNGIIPEIEKGKKSLKELDPDMSLLADARTKGALADNDYDTLKKKIDAEKARVAGLETDVADSMKEADESEAGSIKWHKKKTMTENERATLDKNLVGWEKELAEKKKAKDEALTAWTAAKKVQEKVDADASFYEHFGKYARTPEQQVEDSKNLQERVKDLNIPKKGDENKETKEKKVEIKEKKEENYDKGKEKLSREALNAIGMDIVKDKDGNDVIVKMAPKIVPF